MVKLPKNEIFKAGETVACYSGEVLSFAEVLSVENDTVTVKQLVTSVPPTYEACAFIHRTSDGLYVEPGSMEERVPTRMITHEGNLTSVNNWRYSPSIVEKFIRRFLCSSYIYIPTSKLLKKLEKAESRGL